MEVIDEGKNIKKLSQALIKRVPIVSYFIYNIAIVKETI